MPKYVSVGARARPRGDYDWDVRSWTSEPNVHVDEYVPVATGIVDQRGNAIYRVNPPIGFGRMGEW